GRVLRLDAGADLASDAGAAEAAIAVWVLGEILLVVILGKIELRRRQDFRGDGSEPARLQRLLVRRLGRLGRALLLLGEIIDAGTVFRADVVSLTHAMGRVVRLEEGLEKLLVADLRRVVNEEHSLVMPGHARTNLFVSRVRREPAGIADGGDVDARHVPELPLGAP